MAARPLPVSACSLAAFTAVLALSTQSHAQTPASPPRPPYQELRYYEDWGFLKDPARHTDPWDALKYISFGENAPNSYLSIGAESRIRYEFFRNAGFGSSPETPNGFLLQRYLLHADAHIGKRLRVFTQFQSGLEYGRAGGPRLTDQNTLELHQAFVDVSTSEDPKKGVTVRAGRQELEFGAGHFISASEVFNVRRTFDGVRLFSQIGGWTWNALVAKPVVTKADAFDDIPDHQQSLWAVGAFGRNPLVHHATTSLYYIGLDRKVARFDQGAGRDQRHTIGSRTFGKFRAWDYNYELMLQFGEFAGHRSHGLGAASDTGYSFPKARFAPRLGFRANITSGDKDPRDPSLGTFYPLFPGTAYSGKIGLIGPANVIDTTPTLRLRLHRRVYFLPEDSFFWRDSKRDGIYSVLGPLSRTGQRSDARFVGNQLSLPVQVSIDRHLTYTVLYSRFFAGRFLKETLSGRSVTYLTTFLTYKF